MGSHESLAATRNNRRTVSLLRLDISNQFLKCEHCGFRKVIDEYFSHHKRKTHQIMKLNYGVVPFIGISFLIHFNPFLHYDEYTY